MFLSSGCVLITSFSRTLKIVVGQNFPNTLTFLGQTGTRLSYQARRSSATHSSTSDLNVLHLKALATLVTTPFEG